MARIRVSGSAGAVASGGDDVTTQLSAVTTLITAASTSRAALATARTTASESNATVGTAVTAVQTAITAVQTAVTALATDVGAAVVVDVDMAAILTINQLKAALNNVVDRYRQLGLT